MKRGQCLYTPLSNWEDSSYSYCKSNDWLYDSNNYQWTMTPMPHSSRVDIVFRVAKNGRVGDYVASNAYAVRPVIFLKSSVKITGEDGTSENPFALTQ